MGMENYENLEMVSCEGGGREHLNFPFISPGPPAHGPENKKDPTTLLFKVLYGFQPSFSQYGGRPQCLGRRGFGQMV